MSLTPFFSHKTLRRIIVTFGTLFNGYQVQKQDNSLVDVPITWASKSKWYTLLKQDPNKDKKTAITLPRMGFSMSGMNYDFNRKTPSLNKITRKNESDPNTAYNTYSPVPYNLDFDLFLMTKTIDEGLQIVEQITPYFTPAFSVSITEIDELENTRDVPIKLNSVTPDLVKEGTFDGNDVYVWDFSFTVEANLYKAVGTKNVIKHVIIDTYVTTDADNESYKERYTADVDPESAYISDEYEILESLGLVEPDEPKTF